ncbi:MAG: ferredoxin [Bacilli bacterium]|nr:ferredoxin [Bacilli bacterium]
MKVLINKDSCIGCGACSSICPEVFDMNDDGVAITKDKEGNVPEREIESATSALENCPTGAISEEK